MNYVCHKGSLNKYNSYNVLVPPTLVYGDLNEAGDAVINVLPEYVFHNAF